jgi:hypothetical protein
MHDLHANRIYVRLMHALHEVGGLVDFPHHGLAAVELLPENWYGDKSLMLAFYDHARRSDDEIRADGFASISVYRNQWGKTRQEDAQSIGPKQVPAAKSTRANLSQKAQLELAKQEGASKQRGSSRANAENTNDSAEGLPSCQLPFFYEYDRGSKSSLDVARQLLSYHLLARTRKAAERFPDLDIPGYAVPVLMVFSDRARLRNAHRRFLELAAAADLVRGVPIILVAEEDWLADPLARGICRLAWDEKARTFSFMDLLMRASAPLIASRSVLASQTLAIDNKAARRTTGAMSREGLEEQRSRRVSSREDAATERRLTREREQREKLLAGIRAAQSGKPPSGKPPGDKPTSDKPTSDKG